MVEIDTMSHVSFAAVTNVKLSIWNAQVEFCAVITSVLAYILEKFQLCMSDISKSVNLCKDLSSWIHNTYIFVQEQIKYKYEAF